MAQSIHTNCLPGRVANEKKSTFSTLALAPQMLNQPQTIMTSTSKTVSQSNLPNMSTFLLSIINHTT